MIDDEGVTGGESTSDSSTGKDSTDSSDSSKSDGKSKAVSSEEQERKVEALRQEEARLLKSISDRRAERRALGTDPSQSTSDSGTDTTSQKQTDQSGAVSLEEAAKRRAFRIFGQKHPEYADETKWRELQQVYRPRRGSILWEDVADDLEDAHFLLNRDAIQAEASKKAQSDIARKMHDADRADLGGTSSQSSSGAAKVELTPDEKKALSKLQRADPAMTEEKYLKAKSRLER